MKLLGIKQKGIVAIKDLPTESQDLIQQFILGNKHSICAPFDGMGKTYPTAESEKITSGIRSFFDDKGLLNK